MRSADSCECGGHGEVIDTRPNGRIGIGVQQPVGAVRRRRRCRSCGARWSTYEFPSAYLKAFRRVARYVAELDRRRGKKHA